MTQPALLSLPCSCCLPCQVRPVEGYQDTYVLAEFEIEDKPELQPIIPPTPPNTTTPRGWHPRALPPVEPLAAAAQSSTEQVAAAAAAPGDVISDLLILYTPAVLAKYTSLEAFTADALGGVDKANSAYKNSGINLQLNTMGVRQVRLLPGC